jgi:hypothetical protein
LVLAGAFVAAGLLYVAVAVGWVVGAPAADDYRHRRRFDATAWKRDAGHDTKWPTRLTMANDLVESCVLDGKTKAQVLELLGPETVTDKWKDWELVYWLGPERGLFRIDSEWLVIQFSSDGRTSDVRIVRD